MMPPSEHQQQKMLLKSPTKPSLPGVSRSRLSNSSRMANLLLDDMGGSKNGRTATAETGETNGKETPMSRAKSRVQLQGTEIKEPGQALSRVKSKVQVMEVKIVEKSQPGFSRAKSKIQLQKKDSAISLNRNKSKTQLMVKKEIPKKTLVKSGSRAILKDKNDPVDVITDDVPETRNKKKLDKEPTKASDNVDEEEDLDETVTAVAMDHCYSSPSPPNVEERIPGRIAFTDVSVFYFDR